MSFKREGSLKANKGRVIYYHLVGGSIFRGGSKNVLVMYWGVKNKMTYGQGVGSCISSGIGEGRVRCVPLVFLFIKSHTFCPYDITRRDLEPHAIVPLEHSETDFQK